MTTTQRTGNSAGNVIAKSNAKTSKGKLTVKGTTQVLCLENEARIGVYVSNPSGKEVWLALGESATKEEGIWLKKEVGSVFIQGYTGPISCITTAEEGSIVFAEI